LGEIITFYLTLVIIGPQHPQFRSPEEFSFKELDEKVDVYSFGNIIYCLVRPVIMEIDKFCDNGAVVIELDKL